jgi:hypothetical protein
MYSNIADEEENLESGGLRALKRSIQALLECGMICEEEVVFLYSVIAEQEAAALCPVKPIPRNSTPGAPSPPGRSESWIPVPAIDS